MESITKKELRQYYKTNRQDICYNDNYNLAKGYCNIKVFLFLEGIARQKYGWDYKNFKLTQDILEKEFLVKVL